MTDWALNIFVTPLDWVMISIETNAEVFNFWFLSSLWLLLPLTLLHVIWGRRKTIILPFIALLCGTVLGADPVSGTAKPEGLMQSESPESSEKIPRKISTVEIKGKAFQGIRDVKVYEDGRVRIFHDKGAVAVAREDIPAFFLASWGLDEKAFADKREEATAKKERAEAYQKDLADRKQQLKDSIVGHAIGTLADYKGTMFKPAGQSVTRISLFPLWYVFPEDLPFVNLTNLFEVAGWVVKSPSGYGYSVLTFDGEIAHIKLEASATSLPEFVKCAKEWDKGALNFMPDVAKVALREANHVVVSTGRIVAKATYSASTRGEAIVLDLYEPTFWARHDEAKNRQQFDFEKKRR